MAYATNADLLLEFKGLTAWNTATLAGSTVDTWCGNFSKLIDGKIGGKYSTPVDSTASPNSFAILKEICIWFVRQKVSTTLFQQTGDEKTSSKAGNPNDYHQKAMDTLKEIADGTLVLSDATLATSADGVESYTNDNSATLQPPVFKKTGDQW